MDNILRESVKDWTVRRKTFAWPAGLVQYSVDDSLPGLKEQILANARTVFLHGLTYSGNKLRTWSYLEVGNSFNAQKTLGVEEGRNSGASMITGLET